MLNIKKEIEKKLRYSTESSDMSLTLSEDTLGTIEKLNNSKEVSLEYYDCYLVNAIKDATYMLGQNLISIVDRNRAKSSLAHLNRSKSFSSESLINIANSVSLESTESFTERFKKSIMWVWDKIVEAAMSFWNMVKRVAANTWAKTQTSLYVNKKQLVANALKTHGKKEITCKKWTTDVKKIEKIFNNAIDASTRFTKLVETHFSKSSGSNTSSAGVDTLNKALISRALKFEIFDGTTAQERANLDFFSSKEAPKATKRKVSDILTMKEFEACSKSYLDNVEKMESATKNIVKLASKVKNELKKLVKKDDNATKEEKSKRIQNLQNLSSFITLYQTYIRAIFLLALNYRSDIYKAAKACFTEEKNDKKKK